MRHVALNFCVARYLIKFGGRAERRARANYAETDTSNFDNLTGATILDAGLFMFSCHLRAGFSENGFAINCY